jgi:hypothetical protein
MQLLHHQQVQQQQHPGQGIVPTAVHQSTPMPLSAHTAENRFPPPNISLLFFLFLVAVCVQQHSFIN